MTTNRNLQNSSFKGQNLTGADFSGSDLRGCDFTGACIFNWEIKPYTQFTNVYCEYLYLEPPHQNRQPPEGNFQPNELERVLTQFRE